MHGASSARSPDRSRALLRWLCALVVLVLVVAGAASGLTGCGDQGAQGDEKSPGKTVGQGGGEEPESRDAGLGGPDLEWWQRQVPISILLAGGHRGHLKPCGCVTPQRGGLERMASVMQQLRKRTEKAGGAVGAVALGWSMRGDHEPQEQARADYLRASYEALGFSGVLLGATDLTVPAMCQPRGAGGPDVPHPPLNVRVAAMNPASASKPFLDTEVGALKVRALSLLDLDTAAALESGGSLMRGMRMSVSQALSGLRPRPDTLWIVGTSARDETTLQLVSQALKRLGPGIVVDVGGEGGGARRVDRRVLRPGDDPIVVGLDPYGMTVGVLDFEPADQPDSWRVSFRRIDLVAPWEKYGGPLMSTVGSLHDVYRGMLRDERYLLDHPREPDRGARYVGSSACARCHAAIYNDWKKSEHAAALETLRDVSHDWDPACVRCHVVGWERLGRDSWVVRESGFRAPDKTAYLGGVGCESCHGPGSAHVEAPWAQEPFAPDGPNRAKPGKQDTCVQCHDSENTHGFAEGYASRLLPVVDHRRVPKDRRTVMPLTNGGRPPREPAPERPPGGK